MAVCNCWIKEHSPDCPYHGHLAKSESSIPSTVLLALLRKVHNEIDALGEGIPMSAETWDEMEDVLKADESIRRGTPSPECSGSASPDWRMAAEMKRKHDEREDMEGRLCNPAI